MTVNYNLCVSNSSPLTLFKLLLRWKGSIWKAVFLEVIVWLILYNVISAIYRNCLSRKDQESFAHTVEWVALGLKKLPLDFLLGFFVQIVVNRWGVVFSNIGLIDPIALTVSSFVNGKTDQERLWRRNIVRYCVLGQVLVFRDISMQVRNRFPTIDTVVAAGFMLPHEQEKYEELQYNYGKPWMPFHWAMTNLRRARLHGSIASDYLFEKCCEQVRNYRINMSTLTNYDWVPLPIMYPQIVFLAVYIYFTLSLIGSQPPIEHNLQLGIYFPLMSILQFLFYMGWLKVAEALLNPFGEDDDDFETNFLIDRNLAVGLAMVDQCYDDPPAEKPDVFWSSDDVVPLYSEQSASRAINPLAGSAAAVELPADVQEVNMVVRNGESGRRNRKTVSVRRTSTGTVKNVSSLKKRKSTETSCYENKVQTIDEMEMDEVFFNTSEKRADISGSGPHCSHN